MLAAEAVDWTKIHGAYGVVQDMPKRLQAVADGDAEALGGIMGHIEHQERLFPLTLAVIPFLIDILNNDNQADKADLLDDLYFILERHDAACFRLETLRGGHARLMIDLQAALADGVPVYLKLLTDAAPSIRLRASAFVVQFVDAPMAREAIREALSKETDNLTRTVLIYHLGLLPPSNQDNGDTKANTAAKREFLEWITSSTSREVKIASALAWAIHQLSETFGRNSAIPSPVLDILFDVVLEKYGYDELTGPSAAELEEQASEIDKLIKTLPPTGGTSADDRESSMTTHTEMIRQVNKHLHTINTMTYANDDEKASKLFETLPEYLSERFMPDRVFRVLRSFRTSVQKALLASPKLTPLLAHHICRDIIDDSFERVQYHRSHYRVAPDYNTDFTAWEQYIGVFRMNLIRPAEMTYKPPTTETRTREGKLWDGQYYALETVVDCDKFWELPTNLFSFFYGLPDDREALRQLAAKNKPSYIKDE